jgi:phage regulator Rha-like protein
MYGIETKVLSQAVKRNLSRFPADFMFQLNNQDVTALRSQIVTSKTGRGGRRYPPYVFTEQGVAMLSSVLNSERAVKVKIEIMRTFVRLRQMLASNAELAVLISI